MDQPTLSVAVTGDRQWGSDRYPTVRLTLEALEPAYVILGDARGVDALAHAACEELDLEHVVEIADWRQYGRGAGPQRNARMLDHQPDLVVYFHDDLESSRGTRNCVDQARRRGIAIRSYVNVETRARKERS